MKLLMSNPQNASNAMVATKMKPMLFINVGEWCGLVECTCLKKTLGTLWNIQLNRFKEVWNSKMQKETLKKIS